MKYKVVWRSKEPIISFSSFTPWAWTCFQWDQIVSGMTAEPRVRNQQQGGSAGEAVIHCASPSCLSLLLSLLETEWNSEEERERERENGKATLTMKRKQTDRGSATYKMGWARISYAIIIFPSRNNGSTLSVICRFFSLFQTITSCSEAVVYHSSPENLHKLSNGSMWLVAVCVIS